jgi:hypothetical protein
MTGMTHKAIASYSFFSVRAGAGNRTQRCASDRRHLNRTRRSMLHRHNGTELKKKTQSARRKPSSPILSGADIQDTHNSLIVKKL